jgi:hypothetical protein
MHTHYGDFSPSYGHQDDYAEGYKTCRFDMIRMLLKNESDVNYLKFKLPGLITIHNNSIHAIGSNNFVDIFQLTIPAHTAFNGRIQNFQPNIDKIDLSYFNQTYEMLSPLITATPEGNTQLALRDDVTLILDGVLTLGIYDFILC